MVEKHITRKVIELSYSLGEVHGFSIDVVAVGEDGDTSKRENLANDGQFIWTYPADFKGEVQFNVYGSNSGSDEGVVYLD